MVLTASIPEHCNVTCFRPIQIYCLTDISDSFVTNYLPVCVSCIINIVSRLTYFFRTNSVIFPAMYFGYKMSVKVSLVHPADMDFRSNTEDRSEPPVHSERRVNWLHYIWSALVRSACVLPRMNDRAAHLRDSQV